MGITSLLSSCGSQGCSTTANPNPKKFEILELHANKHFTIAKIRYPDCTNYEGIKILVYKGHIAKQLVKAAEIDPHFCEKHLSPIARFAPTAEGLKLALNLIIS